MYLYFLHFYTHIFALHLYKYIKNENNTEILPLRWFRGCEKGRYGTYLDNMLISDNDETVLLSDFFKHYKV